MNSFFFQENEGVKTSSGANPHGDLMGGLQPRSTEISLRDEKSLEELGKIHGPPDPYGSEPEDHNKEITERNSH
jgi:hypothetical protein